MTLSVLLERKDDVLEKLHKDGADPQPTFLFDTTELQLYRQQSPIWMPVDPDSDVLKHVVGNPCELSGLVMQSQAPQEVLLAHLRHILFVRSEQAGRSVLRYWSPTTASYFFTTDDAALLATWLGPISRISWLGGTWADQAQGGTQLLHIDNPHAATWQPPDRQHLLFLDPLQQQVLQRQQYEHIAWLWCQGHEQVPFAAAMDCLRTHIDNGITGTQPLKQALQQLTDALQNRTPLT